MSQYLNMMKKILYGAHSNVAMGFEYLNMMKKISYGAHSNVAMALGWRAADCVTKL